MGESGQRDRRKGGVGTKLWCVQLCFIHLKNQIKSNQIKSSQLKSSLVAWELGWVDCNDFFNEPATKVY
jgi:hypothetical protein